MAKWFTLSCMHATPSRWRSGKQQQRNTHSKMRNRCNYCFWHLWSGSVVRTTHAQTFNEKLAKHSLGSSPLPLLLSLMWNPIFSLLSTMKCFRRCEIPVDINAIINSLVFFLLRQTDGFFKRNRLIWVGIGKKHFWNVYTVCNLRWSATINQLGFHVCSWHRLWNLAANCHFALSKFLTPRLYTSPDSNMYFVIIYFHLVDVLYFSMAKPVKIGKRDRERMQLISHAYFT